jgi:hypothetical protein
VTAAENAGDEALLVALLIQSCCTPAYRRAADEREMTSNVLRLNSMLRHGLLLLT